MYRLNRRLVLVKRFEERATELEVAGGEGRLIKQMVVEGSQKEKRRIQDGVDNL